MSHEQGANNRWASRICYAIGNLVDNTTSRFGRFKPWQVIGGVGSSILLFAIFTGLFGLVNVNKGVFIVVFIIVFVVLDVLYSLRDISRLAQAQQLSQEEGVNLAGITRILELEEENRELRRQVERLRKPAGSSVFAADADGGIVEVERSQRARMWRRQLRADARQLPSRESVRAERAEEGDDMGSRSVVVWGIR